MRRSSPSLVGPYANAAAACLDYDPQFPLVAQYVGRLITEQVPDVRVEHVGSTSVPGCHGKGIIDLAVLYPAGRIEAARQVLAALGFQPQTTRDPFPEERPMRTGAIEWQGRTYRLHVHVIAGDAPEASELLAFRDRLRADPALREAYVATKLQILARGVTDSLDYCLAKGSFVQDCLRAMR